MEITVSEFEGNTASSHGNNIYSSLSLDISCKDVTNTFELVPPDGVTSSNDFQGNFPADICN
jgi:hypothetical protein